MVKYLVINSSKIIVCILIDHVACPREPRTRRHGPRTPPPPPPPPPTTPRNRATLPMPRAPARPWASLRAHQAASSRRAVQTASDPVCPAHSCRPTSWTGSGSASRTLRPSWMSARTCRLGPKATHPTTSESGTGTTPSARSTYQRCCGARLRLNSCSMTCTWSTLAGCW